MDSELRELQLIFIDEALGFLDGAEEGLISLEASGFDEKIVNTVFRYAHNFKGSANSVGYDKLGRLAHAFEDLLAEIKSGKRTLTTDLISLLLTCTDALRQDIKLYQDVPDHEPENAGLYKQLKDVLAADSTPTSGSDGAAITAPSEISGFGIFDDTLPESEAPTPQSPPPPQLGSPAATVSPGSKQAKANVDETLKIPASRLDQLLNIIGEIVVNQAILDQCLSTKSTASPMALDSIGYMSKLVSDIQALSLSLRLTPIKPLFQKLRRTARDVAASLGKKINLREVGEYSEIDKRVIEVIADPLNHMIRNAIDHGVDTVEERQLLGKPEVAQVSLEAYSQDDRIKIIVADDGRGLDRDKILAKARANGFSIADNTSDEDVFKLIFAPGFSTAQAVTDVSGRGVGMEVVQRAVDDLKGQIEIRSKLGKGTQFVITLPLSLSIVGGMVVRSNGDHYVIPVSQLIETIELTKYPISTVTGMQKVVDLRGEVIPIYDLNMILKKHTRGQLLPGKKATADQSAFVSSSKRPALVTTHKGRKVSFEVQDIVNQQKIVLKPLGKEFENVPGVVAGAVLSNGDPGLVLSLNQLVAAG